MNDILWLTMRRMRTPLILIMLVYTTSVFGMVLIPGVDESGQPISPRKRMKCLSGAWAGGSQFPIRQ